MRVYFKYTNLLFLTVFSLIGCASADISKTDINPETRYKFKNELLIKGSELKESVNLIDKFTTYEIEFELTGEVPDLYLKISKETVTDSTESKKIYFVIEKAINTAHFKDSPPVSYVELYRNFDESWMVEKIDYIKSQQDPLLQLTKGLYRIRFTDFSYYKNDFKLIIYSDGKIIIGEKK